MDAARSERYRTLYGEIGHTPLYEIRYISIPNGNRIFAKEEYQNPTGSHYDRVFLRLFEGLEEEGLITTGDELVETTSGNAGASFAWLCSILGYKGTVLIPEDMPVTRIAQIRSFGVNVHFTPARQYVSGVIEGLRGFLRLQAEKGRRIYCLNHAESRHSVDGMRSCGYEILEQLREHGAGQPDFFIAALGGGISASAICDVLDEQSPSTKTIGFEPFEAPENYIRRYPGRFESTYGMAPALGPHELLGIGRWGDTSYTFPHIETLLPRLSEIMLITQDRWMAADRDLRVVEAKFVGHTSAAALSAALDLCRTIHDTTVVIIFYDPSWKYLGTAGDWRAATNGKATSISSAAHRPAARGRHSVHNRPGGRRYEWLQP